MILKAPLEKICNNECQNFQPDANVSGQEFVLNCDARREALKHLDLNPGLAYCALVSIPVIVSEQEIQSCTGTVLAEQARWEEVMARVPQEVK